MNKSFVVIIGCVFSVFVFQAFTTQPAPNWQNLKILPQNISKNDLDSVMDHFTASLGVKCGFCHVRNADTKKMEFPKDDKPEKLIARKMMLMAIDINKNYFKELEEELHENKGIDSSKAVVDSVGYLFQYVTCFTCHRGKEKPINIPPVKEENKQ